ncbi:hypothetical protein OUZ56_013862 [Daphnia magna]|uniref:Uncharacterized protein n=1 Tax=Daphnia magna TaxID=35525 RepID=A0ABQ9Z755_9CRUS|nr:hypothetical protein OUZ56_013862 [Daphnia magna]
MHMVAGELLQQIRKGLKPTALSCSPTSKQHSRNHFKVEKSVAIKTSIMIRWSNFQTQKILALEDNVC